MQGQNKAKQVVTGIITRVDFKSKFASCYLEQDYKDIKAGTHITFSLDFWQSPLRELPQKSQRVTLEGLQEFLHGWRASKATPITVETER